MKKSKIFIGSRLRQLRKAHELTQSEMGERLNVSGSYINLLENNQRSASLALLIALNDSFGINMRDLSPDQAGIELADLRQIMADPVLAAHQPDLQELRAALDYAPEMTKGFHALFNAYKTLERRFAAQSLQSQGPASQAAEHEQRVHDFFRNQGNFFESLEGAAHRLVCEHPFSRDEALPALKSYLRNICGVEVRNVGYESLPHTLRYFDQEGRKLFLTDGLDHINKTFQVAHCIALISFAEEIEALIQLAGFAEVRLQNRCRTDLANYFAGALLMPYADFLNACQHWAYDLSRIAAHFSVSFEHVCHRITTLQRPGAKGIPFFFMRIDKAGNVSKRLNSTPLQLARYGGACPKMDTHYSFRTPGRILTQFVEMPEGDRYITLNRTVPRPEVYYKTGDRRQAVVVGCEAKYMGELTYTRNAAAKPEFVEVGINCRLCPREHCDQRAFDSDLRAMPLDPHRRGVSRFDA